MRGNDLLKKKLVYACLLEVPSIARSAFSSSSSSSYMAGVEILKLVERIKIIIYEDDNTASARRRRRESVDDQTLRGDGGLLRRPPSSIIGAESA